MRTWMITWKPSEWPELPQRGETLRQGGEFVAALGIDDIVNVGLDRSQYHSLDLDLHIFLLQPVLRSTSITPPICLSFVIRE